MYSTRNIDPWMIVSLVLLLVLAYIVVSETKSSVSPEATNKVMDFINSKIVVQGGKASLVKAYEENGLYVIVWQLNGRNYTYYATKDGQLVFPRYFNTSV